MSARRTLLHPSSHPAVLVLGLLLAACGGSDSETSTPAESLDVSPTFVGADTPGGSEVFGTVDRGAAGEKDTTEPAGTGDEGAGEGGDGGAQGGVDPGSSTGTDTKLPPIEECVLEVPDHVDMTTPVWGVNNVHFYVPKATWAMAMAHAHRIMENDRVPMSAGAIFATALKESFMGCSKSAPPDSEHEGVAWKHQSHADADGCFQIECATAYSEMKRIFPERFGPTTHAEVISSKGQTEEGGDHFETSALTMAHYNVWAVSMMRRYHPNPRRFLREHPDREAGPKAVAIVYNRGAWSAEIEHVFNACATAPDIADCLDEQVGCSPGATDICDYVRAVGSYTGRLQSHAYHPGTCYDEDIGPGTSPPTSTASPRSTPRRWRQRRGMRPPPPSTRSPERRRSSPSSRSSQPCSTRWSPTCRCPPIPRR